MSHYSSASTHLRVIVLVGDEVMRLGLAALLSSLSVVKQVSRHVTWGDAEQSVRAGEADVVVLHESDEWQHTAASDGYGRAATLLLLNDHRAKDRLFQFPHMPDGFVVRGDLSAETLTTALQRITSGEVAMPNMLARDLMQRAAVSTPHHRRNSANLTTREYETLVLLAQGLSNKQIAQRLRISTHGAKRLVANLLMKLDSPNRTMAVVTAINSGLIQGDV